MLDLLDPWISTQMIWMWVGSRGSQWQRGIHLCSNMREVGIKPDMITYGGLACAFGQGDTCGPFVPKTGCHQFETGALWSRALRLCKRASAVLCGAIITACTSALQWRWGQVSKKDSLHFFIFLHPPQTTFSSFSCHFPVFQEALRLQESESSRSNLHICGCLSCWVIGPVKSV